MADQVPRYRPLRFLEGIANADIEPGTSQHRRHCKLILARLVRLSLLLDEKTGGVHGMCAAQ